LQILLSSFIYGLGAGLALGYDTFHLRYPDNFYMPTLEEAKEAYLDALKVKKFVCQILHMV